MHHGAVPDDLGQLLESESDMAQHSSNVLDAEDDVVGPASPIALSEASQSVEDMLEELAQGMLHGAEEDVEVDDACVQQRLDAAMKEYAVSIATLKKAYPTANIFIKHLEGIGFATDGLILDTENGEIMSSEVVLSRLISEEDPAWMSMMPQQTKSAAKRLAQACVLEGGAELAEYATRQASTESQTQNTVREFFNLMEYRCHHVLEEEGITAADLMKLYLAVKAGDRTTRPDEWKRLRDIVRRFTPIDVCDYQQVITLTFLLHT
ncbi:hypothetical protein AB1Y20_010867 [Prymnesium parvum]|uniref:Uncharacterized protein n=1 Tax=Prymnesium parvum TaxID=97485 RepID=A0AB34IQH8_PRYPA